MLIHMKAIVRKAIPRPGQFTRPHPGHFWQFPVDFPESLRNARGELRSQYQKPMIISLVVLWLSWRCSSVQPAVWGLATGMFERLPIGIFSAVVILAGM